MIDAQVIESDQFIPEGLTRHLRVFAGPGAGKTHWITVQIAGLIGAGVLSQAVQRVACISYTNVAVETITKRLGQSNTKGAVFTIHSFLYNYLVKPYAHLVLDCDGKQLLATAGIQGHDEPRPSFSIISAWMKVVGKQNPKVASNPDTVALLKMLRWKLKDDDINLEVDSKAPRVKYLPTTQVIDYKRELWRRQILEHDDVLYFSWRILNENPELRAFLASRFPYIIVDEFQDTSPIQTQLLRWLAAAGAYVTVAGDTAQGIYGFLGARREDFINFHLAGIQSYKIEGNRRSTRAIVNLLNQLRNDGLVQTAFKNVDGESVTILVGDYGQTISKAKSLLPPSGSLVCLGRSNRVAALMRTSESGEAKADIWVELRKIDRQRASFLEKICTASELVLLESYTEAVRALLKIFRLDKNGRHRKPLSCENALTEAQQRSVALGLMIHGQNQLNHTGSIAELYSHIGQILRSTGLGISLRSLKSGKPKSFLERHSTGELLSSLKLNDDRRSGQTIHKAKGAEFEYVYVSLEKCSKANKVASLVHHIVQPNLDDEEHRITYVGLSRAKSRLFIQVPTLCQELEEKARQLDLEVIRA